MTTRLSRPQLDALEQLAKKDRPVEPMEVDSTWRTIDVLVAKGLVRNRRRFGWTMRTVVITEAGETALSMSRRPTSTPKER